MSASRCTSRATTVPSRLATIVTSWIWSRPWFADSSDSDRVSVHLTGLPSSRAAATQSMSSPKRSALPPKPPPTSGAITRILDSGTPMTTPVKVRRMWGIWVAA